MTTPSGDHLVGRTVAQYEVLARLGGGGMGVVYKARDTRLGRTVALKFLPPQWSHDEDAKQRFVREAQAASATDHRNICTIHDIATADDGQLFIVMAYYEGVTLKQRIEGGPLKIDEALDIATQVADGLARAHAQGVVHRDVKPGNIILAEDGVRILDFGLATFVDALQLTVVGSTLGTAAYMSPEQVRGDAADARTDVWAAGIILYQMLAGHVPFRGAYAEAIAHAIRSETPASLRAGRPDVPEDVEQVVFRALHKEAAVRYPSGRELARALRQVRGQTIPLDLRTEPVALPAERLAPARRRSRRPLWFTAAAAVIAVLAGAAWMMRPAQRPTVVVQPISNLTGRDVLGPYQRALTVALIDGLSTSPAVRPVPWVRSLQILRAFDGELGTIATADALAGLQGTQTLVVPTLLHEDDAWRIRIDIFDDASRAPVATYESDPVVSSLEKDTAYALALEGARLVDAHFGGGSWRLLFRRANPSPMLASLDAVRAFEAGIDAFDQQEYGRAHAAFGEAARMDASSALAAVWQSRAALLLRDRAAAASAATTAERLIGSGLSGPNRLLAEATIAEARGDVSGAAERWRALIAAVPDEPGWLLELAMFEERRAGTREEWSSAIGRYRDVLAVDPAVVRPHVDLCWLYNRLEEGPSALREGRAALAAYRTARWPAGEALAAFCLVDTLRNGSRDERAEARTMADGARALLSHVPESYHLPRAIYLQGLAAAEQSQLQDAVMLWQEALAIAERVANLPVQGIVLNNLGGASASLGKPALAATYYSRSGAIYEAIADERRAVRQQYGIARLRTIYGVNDDALLGMIDNVLAVVRKLGDYDYEVSGLESRAQFLRHVARFDDAATELNRAVELAGKHTLTPRLAALARERALLLFDRARYVEAYELLAAAADGTGRGAVAAQVIRARCLTRLGDFEGARRQLAAVRTQLDASNDSGLRPAFHFAAGELEYEGGRNDAARAEFHEAAVGWQDAFAEEAVVESAAFGGLLDALAGQQRDGLARLTAGVERAKRTGWVFLEARLRLLLATAHGAAGNTAEAARAVAEMPERWTALGPEWVARIHYWRSRTAGDAARAAGERAAGKKALAAYVSELPPRYQETIAARHEIRDIGR